MVTWYPLGLGGLPQIGRGSYWRFTKGNDRKGLISIWSSALAKRHAKIVEKDIRTVGRPIVTTNDEEIRPDLRRCMRQSTVRD